jgi:hypothetical protein
MDQLLIFAEIIAVNALVALPIVALVMLIGRGLDLESGNPLRYAEPGWPHGVQEEDSPPWRVELAHPRARESMQPARPIAARSLPQGCEVAPAR